MRAWGAFLSFMLGVVPIEMTGAMIAQSATEPGAPPGVEMNRKLKEFDDGYGQILAKHGIERFDLSTEIDMRDPTALTSLAKSRLGHIDHAAFVSDAIAFVESVDESGPKGQHNPLALFDAEVKKIHIDDDRAYVEVVNVDQRIQLIRIDARWFLLLIPTAN